MQYFKRDGFKTVKNKRKLKAAMRASLEEERTFAEKLSDAVYEIQIKKKKLNKNQGN